MISWVMTGQEPRPLKPTIKCIGRLWQLRMPEALWMHDYTGLSFWQVKHRWEELLKRFTGGEYA